MKHPSTWLQEFVDTNGDYDIVSERFIQSIQDDKKTIATLTDRIDDLTEMVIKQDNAIDRLHRIIDSTNSDTYMPQ